MYVLVGILIGLIIMPIISNLQELFSVICEVLKSKLAIHIARNQVIINEYAALENSDSEGSTIHAIGFQVPDEDDYYDDGDDD